jgi:mannitol operon transcriptional antiterminator
LAFLYEDNNDYSLHAFFEVTFGKKLVASVKSMMKQLYSESRMLKDNDVDNFSTFIHLLLAIERTRSNMAIELPEDIIKDTLFMNEFSIIKDLKNVLHENEIELPESELAYLAIHLMEDRNIYSEEEKIPKELGFDLEDAVWEIVSITSKRLNIPIASDNQLVTGLGQHINPALYRLTMGLEVRNPIINDIKEYYKELYEAVDYACKVVFSKYNLILPANEVGYVTMHIGAAIERQQGIQSKLRVLVICPNGISTVKILCGKLKSKFPEIDEVDACSLREMDEKIKEDYDIVLSTVDVSKKSASNILFISPFLPSKDIEHVGLLIKNKIGEGGGLKKSRTVGFYTDNNDAEADFDAADKMFQNFKLKTVATDDIRSTIREIILELSNTGVIGEPERVENQILKREAKGSVVIPGSHVALVHIRTEEIDAPFVGVFRLEHYIQMKSAGFSVENVDTILVMLARKNEKDFILEMLGKISASLVESDQVINVLRLGDIADIRNELIEIINREERL